MKIVEKDREKQWELIKLCLVNKNSVFSKKDNIEYFCEFLVNNIGFERLTGKSKGKENFKKEDFLDAVEAISSVPDISTENIKKLVTPAIYTQRSPFLAILMAAKILK